MSYDICLKEPGTNQVCVLPEKHQMKGGTYALGGTDKAEFNITYNYAKIFYSIIDEEYGIRKIYGMTGNESIELLKTAISKLNDDVPPEEDYWKPTEGNAKIALQSLLELARQCPNGVWDGD